MSKLVMVCSYKGGVGKTTLSAALAHVAALNENRVIAVDLDLEFGGLDIALGAENAVGGSFLDLLRPDGDPASLLLPCQPDNLSLVAAPMAVDQDLHAVEPAQVERALGLLKAQADLVVLDMPAGGGPLFEKLATSRALDEILLISTDAPTSLRSAEKCGVRLGHISGKPVRLCVNCYNVNTPRSNQAGLFSILETVCLPAIGVIPFDPAVASSLSRGVPVTAVENSLAGTAIENIFYRLAGEQVPLLDGILSKRKRKKLY